MLTAWHALLSAPCTVWHHPLAHDLIPQRSTQHIAVLCCAVQVSGTIITAAGAEVDRLVATGRRAVEMAGRQQSTPQVGAVGLLWITCWRTQEPCAFVTVWAGRAL